MRRPIRFLPLHIALFGALLGGLTARPADAWHEKEHTFIARLAVETLPDTIPAFFREGAMQISHGASDPDVIKQRDLVELRTTEYPNHFIDIEMLDGAELPRIRLEFYKLCYDRKLDPEKVGTLPWAVIEWTQRLTYAFAEHRAYPDNPYIRNKCLVYAGILAHYLADTTHPLHTTIHWDGRVAGPGDKSPRTGIHRKVDGLLRKLDVDASSLIVGIETAPYADVREGFLEAFNASHALVDRVYELEQDIPEWEAAGIADAQVKAFALERARAAITFTARMYHTAWVQSAEFDMPEWNNRPRIDQPGVNHLFTPGRP